MYLEGGVGGAVECQRGGEGQGHALPHGHLHLRGREHRRERRRDLVHVHLDVCVCPRQVSAKMHGSRKRGRGPFVTLVPPSGRRAWRWTHHDGHVAAPQALDEAEDLVGQAGTAPGQAAAITHCGSKRESRKAASLGHSRKG